MNRIKPIFCTGLLFVLATLSQLVYAQCESSEGEVRVVINPDRFPGETSWELLNDQGTVILNGQAMGDSICVDTSMCLTFNIYDSSGDGLCCGFGEGNYQVYYDDVLIGEGADFGARASLFIGCPVGFSCFSADPIAVGTHIAPNPEYWYLFIPTETASYTISTCDMTSCNTILFIYDNCTFFGTGDSNEGTTFYNDDECGEQSSITGAFEEGQEYYIRVGDQGSSCAGDPIGFEITNNGPIAGCTDPTACNYNPLATVEDGSCIFDGADCPGGSDLVVSEGELRNSLRLTTIENQDQCTIDEGCLGGFNERDIIRFTTYIANIGDEDFYVGRPAENNPLYTYDNCHGHWHYNGYAEYILYDQDGVELPIGFKNGFCVIDLDCSLGGTGKYSCSNQGITAKCADYYSSSLSCQWIDITDVAPGIYTFVVRVNWQRSADALGKFETNYSNNWAQVCLDIGRDADDNPTMDVLNECNALVDCLGEVYGSAQPDCKGICNGPALKGDINESGDIETTDAQGYIDGIADKSLVDATICNDLNGDGEIHVSDVAKLAACLYFGEDSEDEEAPNEPCTFGDQVVNPNQEAIFSIMDVNLEESYFDVGLFNENSFVLGYELNLSGATILDVQNLITTGEYNAVPGFSIGEDKIVSVSLLHQSILKKVDMEPILRVYYSATSDQDICMEVQEVVNNDYHKILHSVETDCFSQVVSSTEQEIINASIKIWPNPAKDNIQIRYPNKFGNVDYISIRNLQGQQIYTQRSANTDNQFNLDVSAWAKGIYWYELVGSKQAWGKFVVM